MRLIDASMRPAQLRRFGLLTTANHSIRKASFNEAGAAAPVWLDLESPESLARQASMRPAQLRRFGFDLGRAEGSK